MSDSLIIKERKEVDYFSHLPETLKNKDNPNDKPLLLVNLQEIQDAYRDGTSGFTQNSAMAGLYGKLISEINSAFVSKKGAVDDLIGDIAAKETELGIGGKTEE